MPRTITIEISDELAERLAAVLPAEELPAFAVAALEDALMPESGSVPDAEVVAALQEGVADARAGRLLTLEEVDAGVEATLAARRREREAAARPRKAA